ncbi:MAG: EscJ/YscJ/HrcJ family type III secretion inner membrane ring protein [Chlamydiae bacterium]|nr:EscJ/YscJ/HrcJ family type III secretion inner membrane ring protein [Chlamydiota bacterium]
MRKNRDGAKLSIAILEKKHLEIRMKRFYLRFLNVLFFLFLLGCDSKTEIVSNIDEREANIIVVFLESKGISTTKEMMPVAAGAEGGGAAKYNIVAQREKAIEAMTLLNQNGLPKRVGPNLLELFAPSGLMNTDKQETIRYQAGLAQQIQNTIMMIDGVIDVSVQISFPPSEALEGSNRITAAVFVKHQGIIDDPNSHLESKIKRLISGSVNGLEINDVTVVSDRSRLNDIPTTIDQGRLAQDFVQVWSITMTKRSLGVFRFIFGTLLTVLVLSLLSLGWILYKVYPLIRENGGFKELLIPLPVMKKKEESNH